MGRNKRQILSNTTQVVLWVGSFTQIYLASRPEGSAGDTGLGLAAWGMYVFVFVALIYMIRSNKKAGVVLKSNFIGVEEFATRKRAGESNETLEGDEFTRGINSRAGASALSLVTFFMMSLWLINALWISRNENDEVVHLLDSVSGEVVLWVMFAFTMITGVIRLYRVSPESN